MYSIHCLKNHRGQILIKNTCIAPNLQHNINIALTKIHVYRCVCIYIYKDLYIHSKKKPSVWKQKMVEITMEIAQFQKSYYINTKLLNSKKSI